MRCSEPDHRAPSAIHASRGPGRLAWIVSQKMKRSLQFAAFSLLLPSVAFAHGQQVLGLPVGQMAAMLVVILVVLLLRIAWSQRAVAVLSALGSAIVTWFIPTWDFMGMNFGYGMIPWFVLGIAPPLFVGTGVCILFVLRRPSSHANREK